MVEEHRMTSVELKNVPLGRVSEDHIVRRTPTDKIPLHRGEPALGRGHGASSGATNAVVCRGVKY
jgi:hypothetical protein